MRIVFFIASNYSPLPSSRANAVSVAIHSPLSEMAFVLWIASVVSLLRNDSLYLNLY